MGDDSVKDTVEKIREAAKAGQLDRINGLILAAKADADTQQKSDVERTLLAKLPGILSNNYLIPLRRVDFDAFERVNPEWATVVQRAAMAGNLAAVVDEMVRRLGAISPT